MTEPLKYPFTGWEYDQVAGSDADLDLWRSVVAQIGGRVLELGVGTGRLALQLCKLCDEYHGIDQEPSMLDVLRGKLGDRAVPIVLHTGSFIELDLGRIYDLVFIPGNTISHVVTNDDAEQFFPAVRRHLSEGGFFMIDTFNPRPHAHHETYEFNRYLDPNDQREVIVLSTPVYGDGIVTHHLEHLKGESCVRRSTLAQRLYTGDDLAEWLGRAGFSRVEFFGDYELGPLAPDSARLIAVAA